MVSTVEDEAEEGGDVFFLECSSAWLMFPHFLGINGAEFQMFCVCVVCFFRDEEDEGGVQRMRASAAHVQSKILDG